MKNTFGKWNIGIGFSVMAAFMVYGFILVYLRDFAPGKEEWIASYATGKHFEARLAHVHGNLFSLLNIVFGFIMAKLTLKQSLVKWASWLALGGLLMPLGILGEVYLSLPFYFVLIGGLSMFMSTVLLAMAIFQMNTTKEN